MGIWKLMKDVKIKRIRVEYLYKEFSEELAFYNNYPERV
jgi:hypothetical protein